MLGLAGWLTMSMSMPLARLVMILLMPPCRYVQLRVHQCRHRQHGIDPVVGQRGQGAGRGLHRAATDV